MTVEEKKAIKSLKGFNYTMQGTLSVKEGKTILNLIEKYKEELELKDKVIKQLENGLRNIKKDLDFEPWSIYKVDGMILFDMASYLEVKENKE